jgi:histone acetyltransferase 1
MRPHLKTTYSQKYKALDGNEPTNIREILEEGGHLPKSKLRARASERNYW